jgi:dTDP-4-amino-4,6-dideoxygalactose transaminase
VHYIPLHYHPYYRDMGWRRGDFPEAERYYQRCLSLPLYQDLSEAQQDQVVCALRQILQDARAA